jgi:hypothetical protein
VEIYDRREVKGRYDDIVFVINRTKVLPSTWLAKSLKMHGDT